MSEEVKVVLPKLGESIFSATVVRWLKNVGDQIQEEEPLLEVSTDKINSEIPSPVSGFLKEVLVKENETVEIGAALGVISCEAIKKEEFLSPLIINLAKEHGIEIEEIKKIKGSGLGGRVTKKDILDYVDKRQSGVILEELGVLRKGIAENLSRSFHEAPHASLVVEIDVTDILEIIKVKKDKFFEHHGVKLTITSFLAWAIAKSARKFPYVNSSYQDNKIAIKPDVNLGIAVNVDGGLLVPVIKNCDRLDISHIAKEIFSLAERSRKGLLPLELTQGGSLTMTNFGNSKAIMGFPILRYPEAAILGIGAIAKRAVVIEDKIMVRSLVNITLTFDHRVFDGMYGCAFLGELKNRLEKEVAFDIVQE